MYSSPLSGKRLSFVLTFAGDGADRQMRLFPFPYYENPCLCTGRTFPTLMLRPDYN